MKIRYTVIYGVSAVCAAAAIYGVIFTRNGFSLKEVSVNIKLPAPGQAGTMSLEQALAVRRSVRNFDRRPLKLTDISQLCWAAQGLSSDYGLRTAPSAGALYPLELYVAAGSVTGLSDGIYHYNPHKNELRLTNAGNKGLELARAAFGQECIRDGAAVFIITAVYDRTTRKYLERGIRYVHMEAGHAAQNLLLQAVALKLGAVVIGAFDDREISRVAGLKSPETPLYLIPAGHTVE